MTGRRERPQRGLLDTSTLILLPQLRDAVALPVEPLISTITLAELCVGPLVARTASERAARQAHLQQTEADVDPVRFDAAAARAFGRVAASLRQAGRKPAARSYDAMIAAVAVANGLPLGAGPGRPAQDAGSPAVEPTTHGQERADGRRQPS